MKIYNILYVTILYNKQSVNAKITVRQANRASATNIDHNL